MDHQRESLAALFLTTESLVTMPTLLSVFKEKSLKALKAVTKVTVHLRMVGCLKE
jgi:hypothetical protein